MVIFWKILELLAMAFGVAYVVLEVKKAHSMWLFMIIASVLNILVYFHSRFISMGLIQFYYIVLSAYGIRAWAKERKEAAEQHGGVNPETEGKLLVRRSTFAGHSSVPPSRWSALPDWLSSLPVFRPRNPVIFPENLSGMPV